MTSHLTRILVITGAVVGLAGTGVFLAGLAGIVRAVSGPTLGAGASPPTVAVGIVVTLAGSVIAAAGISRRPP